mmetsp:Transcript_9485/g.18847  ORF Transcript_9485/g.18847 Transcript_9485/m.18847 type:complete len:775 (-) Transcript_9485:155-2479(-)|eukprot:CAMPEP_0118805700 /NCGR_PEP_ID=MMETSP1161-20130426/28495_1 /TAXON_ID=249345 /ORGANISM="Picochlorum oklahomensis, Strain CCMP2329" /LENGTH=774 /DNA_ID=CAMNT_0006734705 /DNA_START=127 /DNA_END=2451 /DNA_ORIENTATION=+
MGNSWSRSSSAGQRASQGNRQTSSVRRVQAVTEFKYGGAFGRGKGGLRPRPVGSCPVKEEDVTFIMECLANMLLFTHLNTETQRSVVSGMYERSIPAGEILIQEGDTGMGADELFVVKSGEFEVLQRRTGVNIRVNMKHRGDTFGELSLMYNSPRSATVAATQDSVVWVLERDTFRTHIQMDEDHEGAEDKSGMTTELFMNQVPILSHLSREEKLEFLSKVKKLEFTKGDIVVREGDVGDCFYIIQSGEATVYQHYGCHGDVVAPSESQSEGDIHISPPLEESEEQTTKKQRKINKLFQADFFGEGALLDSQPRKATVVADTELVCLTLDKESFDILLAPNYELLLKEKSPHVVGTRLMKMASVGGPSRPPAMVHIKRRRYSNSQAQWVWEMVRAVGHLDEVWDLNASSDPYSESNSPTKHRDDGDIVLSLVEGVVLGSGAFSRVSVVTEEGSSRAYALKRIRKTAVMRCPEHVYSEQSITRNLTHPFCIRQYGSFQDKYHLYFLFDLMTGGDLMDILVSDASAVSVRVHGGGLKPSCLAPKVKMLKGLEEGVAKFYVASVVLALEYLHQNNVVYRDLKPENIFIDQQGYPKLGDFGFAKLLKPKKRTFTFCGTPGYVAPENVLAHGYGTTVDWWGLGVVTYVLLTGKQPFTSPKTDDQMEIMRRIVDNSFNISFPPYLSNHAKSLIQGLLERKPSKRLGCSGNKVNDIKNHPWFDSFDWESLAARKMIPPRQPKDDAAKRIRELANGERKGGNRVAKESKEELMEATKIFEDF